MKFYADTSWWVASKCRQDGNFERAVSFFDKIQKTEDQVLWTPWQRVEVFNVFHQLEHARKIEIGSAKNLVRLLTTEVERGYWKHAKFDWTNAIRIACELSAKHSIKMAIRSMDLFHVAIALEVSADVFLTFDKDQEMLAKAAGLRLFDL